MSGRKIVVGFPLDFEIEDLTEEQKDELRKHFFEDAGRESASSSHLGFIPFNFLIDEVKQDEIN